MRQIFTQKPSLGTPINFSHPLAKGLVGFWLFNEGSGDLVQDLSENDNHGTLKNMAFPSTTTSGWGPGENDADINFDGNDDYVSIANNSILNITGEITIELLVKGRNLRSDKWCGLVTKGGYYHDSTGYDLIMMDGRLRFELYGLTTNNIDIYTTISDDVLYHIIAVYNLATIEIFKNGKTVGSVASTGVVSTNTDVLSIGRRSEVTDELNGIITYIKIYNRALTSMEIEELYINPYGIFERQKFGLSQTPGMDYLYESSVNLVTNLGNMSTYFKILSTSLSVNFVNILEYFKNLGINLVNNINNIKYTTTHLSENLSINFINPLKYFKNINTNLLINFNNIFEHFKNLDINLVNNISNIKYTTIHLSENIQYNITLFNAKLIQYTFNIIATLVGIKVPTLSKDLNIKFDYTFDTPYNYFKLLLNLLISLNLSDKKKFTLPISFDVISNLIKSVPHSKDIAFTLNFNLSDVRSYTKSVTQYLSLGHVRVMLTGKQIDQLMNLNLIIGKSPIKMLNDVLKITTNVIAMGVVNLSLELSIAMNEIQSYIKRENVNIQFNTDKSLLYTLIKQLNLTLVKSINTLLTYILNLNAQISMNISNIKVISKSIQSNISITLSRNFTFAIGRVKIKIRPIIVKVNSGFTNIRSKLNAGRK